jgi:hypothetical protein
MQHLCKNMQKAVHMRLLTIIGIARPSLPSTTPVPKGCFGHSKIIVIDPALVLEAGDPQTWNRRHLDGTVMHHTLVHLS